jgi:hypothetical protein
MQHIWRIVLVAASLATLLVGGAVALGSRSDDVARTWIPASATEEQQVANVLRDAIRARAVAARTFDVSGIVANVVDDPGVPLTAQQRATLGRVNPAVEAKGQLTAELAFFARWEQGDEAFRRVQQARQAGRAPDPADLSAAMPRRSDPIYELPLTVRIVRIAGDRAYIEAETDAVFYRVTLVHRGTRWFIAGENNTSRN